MFFDIITYLPMYTALFWAIMLLTNKDKGETAKMLLGILMILIFVLDTSIMTFFHHNNSLYLYTDPINTFCTISSFLVFYWYIKLLTKEPKILRKNVWLFAPGLFFALSSSLIYYLMSPTERMLFINNFIFGYEELTHPTTLIKVKIIDFYASKLTFIISVIYVVTQCHTLIKRYEEKISNYYSNLHHISINWAKRITYSLIFIGITSIIVNTLNQPYMLNADIATTLSAIFFGTIIYLIGYWGYRQDYNISNIEYFNNKQMEGDTFTSSIDKKQKDQQAIIEGIKTSFDNEQIHRRQDLKITDIAQALNSNRSYISKIINSEFKCSFIEFVNQYRLLDAKTQLTKYPDETILDISHRAGFSSASTFTRVFKQYEGMSPSHYRKKHLKHQTEQN